nr:polymerase-associated protein [Carnation mottle virus]
MGLPSLLVEGVIGCTLVGGLVAVGSAALAVRATIGVVEFNRECVRGARRIVSSGGRCLIVQSPYGNPNQGLIRGEDEEIDNVEESTPEELTQLIEVKAEVDGKEVVVSKKRVVNRHLRQRFVRSIAIEAKNHFGGDISPSKANYLSVSKFLTGKCKERHVVPAHTRDCVSAAMVLVFTPDVHEIRMMAGLASDAAYARKIAMASILNRKGWCWRLMVNPLDRARWWEMWCVVNGFDSNKPVTFPK